MCCVKHVIITYVGIFIHQTTLITLPYHHPPPSLTLLPTSSLYLKHTIEFNVTITFDRDNTMLCCFIVYEKVYTRNR